MGLFRLVLAYLVVLAHVSGTQFGADGYHFGVVAVICFLLLSGYVMTALIQKYYNSLALIPSFYLDRIARLYPQFLSIFSQQ